MNSSLLINEEIRSGIPEVDEYIGLLEAVITAYTSDNYTRVIAETNRVIGVLADDLSLIADDGSLHGTKLIKEEKNNMAMDRIVKLIQQVAAIATVSRSAVSIGKEIAYALNKDDGGVLDIGQGYAVTSVEKTQEHQISEIKKIQDEKDEDRINSGIPLIESLVEDIKRRTKNK